MKEFCNFIKEKEEFIINEVKKNAIENSKIDGIILCDNILRRTLESILKVMESTLEHKINTKEYLSIISKTLDSVTREYVEKGLELFDGFLILKYYRYGFKSSIKGFYDINDGKISYYLNTIDSFFDSVELVAVKKWSKYENHNLIKTLRNGNKKLINEKNKYVHIFEEFPNPSFLISEEYNILNFNYSAKELLSNCRFEGIEEAEGIVLWIEEQLNYFIKGGYSEISFTKELNSMYELLFFNVKLRKIKFQENMFGILIILDNITYSKNISEELEKSEKSLREITDNMMDMIFKVDIDGIIQYVSPSVKHNLGYKYNDLIGKSIFSAVHNKDVNKVINVTNRALLKKEPFDIELRYKKADTEYIWIETRGNWLYDINDNILGMIISGRDITNRKKIEEDLKIAKTQSEKIYVEEDPKEP